VLKNTNNWRVQLPERKKICLVVKEYKEQINAVFSKECSLKETQSVPEERKVRDKWKNSRVRLVVEQCMRRELWSPLHNKAWNAFRKLVSKIWKVGEAVIQKSERRAKKLLDLERNLEVGGQWRRRAEADGTLKLWHGKSNNKNTRH
jgi:hypothetical protein